MARGPRLNAPDAVHDAMARAIGRPACSLPAAEGGAESFISYLRPACPPSVAGQLTARTEGGITWNGRAAVTDKPARPAIPAERGEGLIRLTPAKGPAALPPLLMEEADLLTWIARPRRPWHDR